MLLRIDIILTHAQRVGRWQKLIQGAPNIFLGWGDHEGIHLHVRQLRDMKGGVKFEAAKNTTCREFHFNIVSYVPGLWSVSIAG